MKKQYQTFPLVWLCMSCLLGFGSLAAQSPEWINHLQAQSIPSEDLVTSIRYDEQGFLYLAGTIYSDIDFDPGPGSTVITAESRQAFLAKYDTSGGFVWVKSWGDNSPCYTQALTLDGQGNVYVAGYFRGVIDLDPGTGVDSHTAHNGWDVYVSSFDSDGILRWATSIVGAAPIDEARGLAVDLQGNIYLAGPYNGVQKKWLGKLDANGALIGELSFEVLTSGVIHSQALIPAPAGGVYVGGYFTGTVDFDGGADSLILTTSGNQQAFLAYVDETFQLQWVTSWGNPAEKDLVTDIELDPQGNIWAYGQFSDSADLDPGPAEAIFFAPGTDAFVAQYDASGAYLQAFALPIVPTEFAVDEAGQLYLSGSFLGTVDFDPGAGEAIRATPANRDLFVASYDQQGQFRWVVDTDGSAYDNGASLTLGKDAEVYVAGEFEGDCDFSPTTNEPLLTSTGSKDIVFLKYDQASFSLSLPAEAFPFLIGPNPAQEMVEIQWGEESFPSAGNIQVFDSQGRFVEEYTVHTQETQQIAVSDWPSGMYVLKFSLGASRYFYRLIKE